MRMLSRESGVELAVSSANSRSLAIVVLPHGSSEGDDGVHGFILGHMVYSRAGGFLIILPSSELVRDVLVDLQPDENLEGPATHECEVDVETVRGRPLGATQAYLVDIPTALINRFCSSATARGRGLSAGNTTQFMINEVMGRPVKNSVIIEADAWIAGNMDHDTAQDYLTGEEEPELEAVQPDGMPVDAAALQARIQELEAMIRQRHSAVAKAVPEGAPMAARSKAPALFPQPPGQGLSTAEWDRLQRLAGAPPPRVASAEQRRANPLPAVTEQENLFAHLDREAEEEQQVDLTLLAAQAGDPLQQMMLAQLQQNQVLLQRLISPKFQDPVLGALAGGSDGSSSSSSGVKGMLARDVFIKAIQDLTKVAAVGQQNALRELGFDDSRLDCSLMRRYVARRIPLAENRQLAYLAFMLAEAWGVGYFERGTSGVGVQDADFHRTNMFGCRKDELGLAHDRPTRSTVSSLGEQQEEARVTAFHEAGKSILGFSESGIRQRLGCAGEQDANHEQGRQGKRATRRSRSSEESWTEETTSPPESKRRQQRRCRAKLQRERYGLIAHKEQHELWSIHGDCASASASQHGVVNDKDNSSHHNREQSAEYFLPALHNLTSVFKPLELVQGLINQFWGCPSALTAFARKSLTEAHCTLHTKPSSSLWPVPPVRWSWTAASRLP